MLRLELEARHRLLLADSLLGAGERLGGALRVAARLLDLRLHLRLLRLERAALSRERSLERGVALPLVHAVLQLELRLLAKLALLGNLRLRRRRLLLSLAPRHLLRLEVLLDAEEHVLQLGVGLGLNLELLLLRLHLRLELREAAGGGLVRSVRHVLRGVVAARALGDGLEGLVGAGGGGGSGGRGLDDSLGALHHGLTGVRLRGGEKK